MKKLLIFSLTLALLAGAGAAWADHVFLNNTLVQSYGYHYTGSPPVGSGYEYTTPLGGSGTPNPGLAGPPFGNKDWYDRIGASLFECYGATLSGSVLTLHTNFGNDTLTDLGAVVADLFIGDKNGVWKSAIALGSQKYTVGNGPSGRFKEVFPIAGTGSYLTSITAYGATYGNIYGGQFDIGVPKDIPVWATSTANVNLATVNWIAHTPTVSDPWNWDVSIDLSILGLTYWSDFTFLWASGTCANDTIEGRWLGSQVPIPGSVLLLGSGLLGLVGLGWRRRKTKV